MILPCHAVRGIFVGMLALLLTLAIVGCFENSMAPPVPGGDDDRVAGGSDPYAGGDPATGDPAGPGDPATGDPAGGGDPPAGGDPPGGSDPPGSEPPSEEPPPPPQEPPPPVDPHEADPPGMVDPFHAKLKSGGYWDGFWTGSTSKMTTDAAGDGVNCERNASCRWLGGLAGVEDPDRFLTRGRIRFRVKVNADGLEVGGGGKHLVNLASTPLSRGRRELDSWTRIEIANPADDHPRFVLHNYIDGQGGAREIGELPFQFVPDRWVEIDWSWELVGRELTMVCNGRTFRTTLLAGSEGPGRYWGPGHFETTHGGGLFTFGPVQVTRD